MLTFNLPLAIEGEERDEELNNNLDQNEAAYSNSKWREWNK